MLKSDVRYRLRVGHPPYPKMHWDALCNLEVRLHMEAVERAFSGGKITKLRYN